MYYLPADDMGLGKTITMIALVASDKDGKIDNDDDDDARDNKKREYITFICKKKGVSVFVYDDKDRHTLLPECCLKVDFIET